LSRWRNKNSEKDLSYRYICWEFSIVHRM
jgi:hypothetical protein